MPLTQPRHPRRPTAAGRRRAGRAPESPCVLTFGPQMLAAAPASVLWPANGLKTAARFVVAHRAEPTTHDVVGSSPAVSSEQERFSFRRVPWVDAGAAAVAGEREGSTRPRDAAHDARTPASGTLRRERHVCVGCVSRHGPPRVRPTSTLSQRRFVARVCEMQGSGAGSASDGTTRGRQPDESHGSRHAPGGRSEHRCRRTAALSGAATRAEPNARFP
jgi:hypothetical protein